VTVCPGFNEVQNLKLLLFVMLVEAADALPDKFKLEFIKAVPSIARCADVCNLMPLETGSLRLRMDMFTVLPTVPRALGRHDHIQANLSMCAELCISLQIVLLGSSTKMHINIAA